MGVNGAKGSENTNQSHTIYLSSLSVTNTVLAILGVTITKLGPYEPPLWAHKWNHIFLKEFVLFSSFLTIARTQPYLTWGTIRETESLLYHLRSISHLNLHRFSQ
jgi:hypothetical protein